MKSRSYIKLDVIFILINLLLVYTKLDVIFILTKSISSLQVAYKFVFCQLFLNYLLRI